MTLQGKGFFIDRLSNCENGDIAAIVATAQAAQLSHVIVKIADGVNVPGDDLAAPAVQALRAAGIAVWGWHCIYGDDPAMEADLAIQQVKSLGLDGYVVDAEDEFKQPGKEAAARQFMSAVRDGLTIPIALSSYRFPHYHSAFPWSAFLEKCDYHMPQVYWEQVHNAGEQLRESRRQCDALPYAKPYLATGAAYGVVGWEATPQDIGEFFSAASSLAIPAVNYFEWNYCRKILPGVWKAIADFDWPAPAQINPSIPVSQPISGLSDTQPVTESETLEAVPEPLTSSELDSIPALSGDVLSDQFLTALNSRKAGQVATLYDSTAVCVLANELLHGPLSIQAAYATFFARLPVGAAFELCTLKVDNGLRALTWKVGSLAGQTTLVLQNGKIILDYTFLV